MVFDRPESGTAAIPQTIFPKPQGARQPERRRLSPTNRQYVVANRISGFLKEYPDVDLQLIENTTSRLLEALQAGDLDLAILSLPLSIPDIVCSELFESRSSWQLPRAIASRT
jgi:LysR family transcriptional regulator, hydrogen peroxide-inducible genes activator